MTMLVKALLAYVLASDQLEPNELEVSVHLQPLEELALVFSISCFRHPPDHHTTTNSYCLWYMRSCFLYPALSSNSSLSLWGSPSSNGLTRGTQRPSPPPHPSFQSKPTNTISPPTPFFHPCCPNPQWYLLKPASLCGIHDDAILQRHSYLCCKPWIAYSAYQQGLFCISQLFKPTEAWHSAKWRLMFYTNWLEKLPK